jgi:hydrogenase nickel incorporation protein HypA/HybF
MAICEGILQSLEKIRAKENFDKITIVRLEIGCFSGVENDAVRFSFDAVTRGTFAENATLEIIEQKGKAYCMDCANIFETDNRLELCPRCNGINTMTYGGDALKIKDLEVV